MIPVGRADGVASREVTTMARGTVVRVIRDRGFGFVKADTGKEIFFHYSSLPAGVFDALTEGQTLEFDVEDDPRGRGERATNVQVVDR
jgi:cold shock protein